MARINLPSHCVFSLFVMVAFGGCAGRTYDLSDHFVVKERDSWFHGARSDIYVRTRQGKLEYVGSASSTRDTREVSTNSPAFPDLFAVFAGKGASVEQSQLPSKRPVSTLRVSAWHRRASRLRSGVAIGRSQDGRSIVYGHAPVHAGHRASKAQGVYQYTYGLGERLLQADCPVDSVLAGLAPIESSFWKPTPSDIVIFERDNVKWAATAEGAMFPLALCGSTPLHRAVFEGSEADLLALLDEGECLDDEDYWGLTPLGLALACDETEAALELLKHGADPTAGRFKPINLAVVYEHWRVLEAMLRGGASPSISNRDGVTPLHAVLARKRFECSSRFRRKEYGVPIPAKEPYRGGTFVRGPTTEAVRLLLDHRVDVNATEVTGNTALHFAVFFHGPVLPERLEVLHLLLSYGADQNVRDADGSTPLHVAWNQKSSKVAQVLIQHGADVNARDAEGNTPLWVAMRHNHPKLALELVQSGADVNVSDDRGNTPLHFAGDPFVVLRDTNDPWLEDPGAKARWEEEYRPLLELLVSKCTDINRPNADGFSPLFYAVRRKAMYTAEFLVANGADDSLPYVPIDTRSFILTTHALEKLESKRPKRSLRDQITRTRASALWTRADE